MTSHSDLTVLICTHDRADSLGMTLASLTTSDRAALQVEVVVVDNASTDHTREAVSVAAGAAATLNPPLAIRYLFEPVRGRYGKSHALNRALDAGALGEIVAVLDDDITVDAHWCRGVLAIAARWPDADFFTGRSYIIWPDVPVPAWARCPAIQAWLFSVQDSPDNELPLGPGQWFTGGHFWFRSRVLLHQRRFEDTWATEPAFMLQLMSEGARAYRGSDAAVGHRIQPALLQSEVAIERAEKVGRSFARVRLDPRFGLRHSRWSGAHPLLARIYVWTQWLRWNVAAAWHARTASNSVRFGHRLVAIERASNFDEIRQILKTRHRQTRRIATPGPNADSFVTR